MVGRRVHVRQLYTRDNIQSTQTWVSSTGTLEGGGGEGDGRGEERTCFHIKCSTLWFNFTRNGEVSRKVSTL